MTETIFQRAIMGKHPVEFYYDGKLRVVHPYIYGKNQKNQPALRAYQTGGNASGPLPAWRPFIVGKMTDIKIIDSQTFIPNAPRYNSNDEWFSEIITKI